MKLTSISDTFADDRIDINGTVEKSGTCYDAHGSFHAAVTLSIQAGQLVANTAVDTPSIEIEVPWYCQLAIAVLGPIGLVISGIVSSYMDIAIQKMMSMAGGLGGKGMTFGTGGFGGATFDDVVVTPEGLTLHGFAPTISMPLPQTPGIKIEGSVVNDPFVGGYGGTPGTYTIGQAVSRAVIRTPRFSRRRSERSSPFRRSWVAPYSSSGGWKGSTAT